MTDLKEKEDSGTLMLHHFKGKRPSARDVSYPMASKIHFLTFVLVLKLVEYPDTSGGEGEKDREKERKPKRLGISTVPEAPVASHDHYQVTHLPGDALG